MEVNQSLITLSDVTSLTVPGLLLQQVLRNNSIQCTTLLFHRATSSQFNQETQLDIVNSLK